ncbi:MAG: hypothetical protein ABIG89_00930 [Candidatus Woesearchaeota archaeon]
MKKRVNMILGLVMLLVICSLLFVSCTKVGDNIDKLKKDGEQLVCDPADNSTDTTNVDKSISDDTGKDGKTDDKTIDSAIAGKVTEEIKKEIPDILDDKDKDNADDKKDDTSTGADDTSTGADDTAGNIAVKTYTEGELVRIIAKATDKDKDDVTFTFSEPLDNNGEWQTNVGDAGTYFASVTASDGKSKVSKKVKIVITPKNKAPVLEVASKMVVKEGDTIILNPKATDPDGDKVTFSYTGWMTSNTKKTGYNDAGSYGVIITASDGKLTATKSVGIEVEDVNRKPSLNNVPDVVVVEGEVVKVSVKAIDADSDKLIYTYLGAPIDASGKWQTKEGDAGTYKVKVTVSDGKDEDQKTFLIVVKLNNKAPVIKPINDILLTVNKGETKTITLKPEVVDEDGDDIVVTYSGWMTSSAKKVTYNDGGDHIVTVTANDGKQKTSIDVKININRPPEFVIE